MNIKKLLIVSILRVITGVCVGVLVALIMRYIFHADDLLMGLMSGGIGNVIALQIK